MACSRQDYPRRNCVACFRDSGRNQQHPDNADRFLGVIPAVAQTVRRCRQQLETPKMLVDLAWRHVSADPRDDHHQGTANDEAEEGCDENEGDDLQHAG
jgi:hypothetical protein